jgi:hypothetical membrane protein
MATDVREREDTRRSSGVAHGTQEPGSRAERTPRVLIQSVPQKIAGVLLALAGVVIFMGIITAEALYPNGAYTTHGNEVSDLGATVPPNSIITQPSATIFDVSMIVTGLLIVGAAYFVYRAFGRRLFAAAIALYGVGVLGAGVFPGNHHAPHLTFATILFVAGGVAAIMSFKVATSPFRYFSLGLGGVSLLVLVLYEIFGVSGVLARLGDGGLERWLTYPILLWLLTMGGYLMGCRTTATGGSSIRQQGRYLRVTAHPLGRKEATAARLEAQAHGQLDA